jgi:hypothetical protein
MDKKDILVYILKKYKSLNDKEHKTLDALIHLHDEEEIKFNLEVSNTITGKTEKSSCEKHTGFSITQISEKSDINKKTLNNILKNLTSYFQYEYSDDNNNSKGDKEQKFFCFIIVTGKGKGTRYLIPPLIRCIIRLQNEDPETNRYILLKGMTNTLIKDKLNEPSDYSFCKIITIHPRPYSSFDISSFAQPAFCANEKLEITKVSEKFKEEFGFMDKHYGKPLIDFFKEQKFKHYDMFDLTNNEDLFNNISRSLEVGGSQINYLPIKQERKDKNKYFDFFLTFQNTFLGIQGTLIDSTQRVGQYIADSKRRLIYAQGSIHKFSQYIGALKFDLLTLKEKTANQDDETREIVNSVFKSYDDSAASLTNELQHIRNEIASIYLNEFDLFQTIDEVVSAYRNVFPEVKFDLTNPNLSLLKRVFATQMDIFRAILEDLISNSIKHRVKSIRPEIIISSESNNLTEIVKIHVDDNGKGFDPFYAQKINNNQNLDVKCSLEYNQSVVLPLIGGKIEIYSRGENKGSKVTIVLPIKRK